MDKSSSFLALNPDGEEKCLLCECILKKKEKASLFKDEGWLNVQEQAKRWSKINVDSGDSKYPFTKVYERINNNSAFGKAHTACRTSFRTKVENYEKKFGLVEDEEDNSVPDSSGESQKEDRVSRRFSSQHLKEKRLCFICNVKQSLDSNPYENGGLGRCERSKSANRLLERKEEYIQDKEHRFYAAANRLQLATSGQSHDIFAIDIYYHQSCYLKFAVNEQKRQKQIDDDLEEIKDDVMSEIFAKIRTKILREKQAFLLSDLLRDIKNLSDEKGVDSPINNTAAMKKKLICVFSERLGFYPSGRQVIIYSSDMNPIEYMAATLKGHGLRDEDLIKACAAMIRRKMEARVEDECSWPCDPNELIEQFDRGPLADIYNMIYATIDKSYKINQYGYATTRSKSIATKVWSLASDWEVLLRPKQKNVKQVIAGMTLHRFTASKQSVVMLHKLGNCISYADIRLQNDAWARMVSASGRISNELAKGISTHATIDNNDGSQDTATGSGTTHDTNCTLFQQVLPGSQLPLSKESKTASNPPSQKRARYAAEFQVDNNEISEETRELDYIFFGDSSSDESDDDDSDRSDWLP
eukprot:gene19707-21653_t